MHIFFASDNKFVLPLINALSSILRYSNKDDFYHFYILDKNISSKNKSRINKLKKIKDFDIEYIKVDDSLFLDCPLTKECKHISLQTYYRYIIPKLKPELKKVLYLDCDILVVGSLRELWEQDLEDFYCAAVEEMYYGTLHDATRLNLKAYFNAGVLLINNSKWVKENVSEKLFNSTRELYINNNLIWQDQDVLNYVFKDNIKWLPPKFNYQQNCHKKYTYTQYSEDDIINAETNTIIIHYNTGTKPWTKGYKCNFKKYEYYQEMLRNKFYFEILKLYVKKILRKILSLNNNVVDGVTYKNITLLGIKFKFEMSKNNNEIFIPIGRGCHTAMLLGKLGLRNCSYPMDWIIPNEDSKSIEFIETRFQFLIDEFKNFFNKEDLIFDSTQGKNNNIKCYNKYTGFIFWHDFNKNNNTHKQYSSIKHKYRKRSIRLIRHIKNAKKVNLVYMQNTWDHMNEMDCELNVDILSTLMYRLQKKYPKTKFAFLEFIHDSNLQKGEYEKNTYENGIIKYYSNHIYTENDEELGTIISIQNILTKEFNK